MVVEEPFGELEGSVGVGRHALLDGEMFESCREGLFGRNKDDQQREYKKHF